MKIHMAAVVVVDVVGGGGAGFDGNVVVVVAMNWDRVEIADYLADGELVGKVDVVAGILAGVDVDCMKFRLVYCGSVYFLLLNDLFP